jgi:hypothetical protein
MAEQVHLAEQTAQAARGRAYGCLFFIGFGTIWMCTGLAAAKHGSAGAYGAVGAVAVCLLALVALLLRKAHDLPTAPLDSDFERRSRLMFRAVNIIQWVSIATAVVILSMLHMPEYIVSAIAIIVALHLFPLAETFRHRQHYWTGALLLVWSCGTLALMSKERVAGVGAIGTGAIMLGSAAWTLVLNLGADAAVGSNNVRA